MKYKGKEVPIWFFILSIIFTMILIPMVIIFFLFLCPAGFFFILIGYLIGKKRGGELRDRQIKDQHRRASNKMA